MENSQFHMSSEQTKEIAAALYPLIAEYILSHRKEYEDFLKHEYVDEANDGF